MWEIDYTQEVKFYFIDNGDLVFDLLVKIEELKFFPTGIPPEECVELEPGIYHWKVLKHAVIYQKIENMRRLRITVVKPL